MIDFIVELAFRHYAISLFCVFLFGLLVDVASALYTKCVAQHKPFWAANWSLAWCVLATFLTVAIIEKSVPHILCYILGSYIGTYVGTKYGYSQATCSDGTSPST